MNGGEKITYRSVQENYQEIIGLGWFLKSCRCQHVFQIRKTNFGVFNSLAMKSMKTNTKMYPMSNTNFTVFFFIRKTGVEISKDLYLARKVRGQVYMCYGSVLSLFYNFFY